MHYKYATPYIPTSRRIKVGSGPFAYYKWIYE
jgi:hypothetical protein